VKQDVAEQRPTNLGLWRKTVFRGSRRTLAPPLELGPSLGSEGGRIQGRGGRDRGRGHLLKGSCGGSVYGVDGGRRRLVGSRTVGGRCGAVGSGGVARGRRGDARTGHHPCFSRLEVCIIRYSLLGSMLLIAF
jgi:hypothetical protein